MATLLKPPTEGLHSTIDQGNYFINDKSDRNMHKSNKTNEFYSAL